MKLCCQENEVKRPKFTEIISYLLQDLSENFRNVSYYHSLKASTNDFSPIRDLKSSVSDVEVANQYTFMASTCVHGIDDACKSFTNMSIGNAIWKHQKDDESVEEIPEKHQQLRANMTCPANFSAFSNYNVHTTKRLI